MSEKGRIRGEDEGGRSWGTRSLPPGKKKKTHKGRRFFPGKVQKKKKM